MHSGTSRPSADARTFVAISFSFVRSLRSRSLALRADSTIIPFSSCVTPAVMDVPRSGGPSSCWMM